MRVNKQPKTGLTMADIETLKQRGFMEKFSISRITTTWLFGKPLAEEQQEKVEAAQRMAEIENPSFFRRHFTWLDNALFGSPEKTQAILDYQRPERTNLEIMTELAENIVDSFAEKVAEKLAERGQTSAHQCHEITAPSSTPSALEQSRKQL